ncbi:MAG: family 10 glycosylhydrolase [Cyanobacteria bacterium J06606_4]
MGSQKKNLGCGCFPWLMVTGAFAWFWLWLVPWMGPRFDIEAARNGDFKAVFERLMDRSDAEGVTSSPADSDLPPIIQAELPVEATASAAPVTGQTAAGQAQTQTVPTQTPNQAVPTQTVPTMPEAWQSKAFRGIYISRYQITNRASEKTIRDRVRYYKAQGINTIIHGVWGNGCTMYKSEVMRKTLGYSSCPNLFQDPWLDWMLDEAHKQGMQVHAYFEKGIKLDENSPIFDVATNKGWFVPGIDKTYPGVDHYILDVENLEVAKYFTEISAEFVRRYPTIDAVQWDDYVGYHEALPGEKDRTAQLTEFMLNIRQAVKQANPKVSFDVCHHNPYWGKRYFDADWASWQVDRAFIQVYNDNNFAAEMDYVQQHSGIAISDTQFGRLAALANNSQVKSVLLFPSAGNPEQTAARFKQVWSGQY